MKNTTVTHVGDKVVVAAQNYETIGAGIACLSLLFFNSDWRCILLNCLFPSVPSTHVQR